jgi:hypothetical protein
MLSKRFDDTTGIGAWSALLGGFHMRTSGKADGRSHEELMQRSIALLEEALQLLDDLGDYPELGARLSGVIEILQDDRNRDSDLFPVRNGPNQRPDRTKN